MFLNKLPVVNEGFFMFPDVPVASDSCFLQFPYIFSSDRYPTSLNFTE